MTTTLWIVGGYLWVMLATLAAVIVLEEDRMATKHLEPHHLLTCFFAAVAWPLLVSVAVIYKLLRI